MRPRRPLSHLAENLVGALLFRRTAVRPERVAELRAEVAALPSQGAGAGRADQFWTANQAELRRLLLARRPTDFLRWDPVRLTMVKRGRASVAHELAHLRARPDWRPRWRPALRESTVGRPRPVPSHPWASGTAIHHAYHLCRFEEATGVRLEGFPLIVEFGGGYGGFCRLLHALGFSGRYVIFDLPVVTALQRFYLRTLGIPVAGPAEPSAPARGVVTVTEAAELSALLRQWPSSRPQAFVALWSFGETPLALRHDVLGVLDGMDALLLGYTERYREIDNVRFFDQWRAARPDLAWQAIPLAHLKKPEWYLFATRAVHSPEPGGGGA